MPRPESLTPFISLPLNVQAVKTWPSGERRSALLRAFQKLSLGGKPRPEKLPIKCDHVRLNLVLVQQLAPLARLHSGGREEGTEPYLAVI